MLWSPTARVVTARVALPSDPTFAEPSNASAPHGPGAGPFAPEARGERGVFAPNERWTPTSGVPESQNAMVPSDEPVGTGATAPTSVTLCPSNPGFGEIVSVVAVVAAALIVSVTTLEVEVAKAPLPLYTAVILFAPSARLVIAKVAIPPAPTFPVPSRVPEPQEEISCAPVVRTCEAPGARTDVCRELRIASGPVPFKQKSTVPSVPPVGVGDTVAVSVTDAPATAGLGDAVSVVVVLAAASMVSVTAVEVEGASVALPLYTAVMLFAPVTRLVVAKVATPFAPTVPVPSRVPEPQTGAPCAPVVRACEADGGRMDRRAEFRIASGPVPFKQKFTVPRVPPVGTGAIVAVSVTDAPARHWPTPMPL